MVDLIITLVISMIVMITPIIPTTLKLKGVPVNLLIIYMLALIYFLTKLIFEKTDFKENIKTALKDPVIISLILLDICMFLSTIYATDKTISINEAARFLSYIIIFIIIKYEIKVKKHKMYIINSSILILLVSCIYGLYQYFTGEYFILKTSDTKAKMFYGFGESQRITSFFENPNSFGGFLILLILPTLILAINEKRKVRKLILWITVLLAVMNLTLTWSRNAWIGFAFGLLILVIVYSKKLLFILIPLGASTLFIPQINIRIRDIFDASKNLSRIKLWETAIAMFKDHPIFGVGNGNYVSLYNTYIKKYPNLRYQGYKNFPSHNSYLKILSELGIVGFIIFMLVIIILIYINIIIIKKSNDNYYKVLYVGIFASLIGFLFMNISDNLLFVPNITIYFWILMALMDSGRLKIKQQDGDING